MTPYTLTLNSLFFLKNVYSQFTEVNRTFLLITIYLQALCGPKLCQLIALLRSYVHYSVYYKKAKAADLFCVV